MYVFVIRLPKKKKKKKKIEVGSVARHRCDLFGLIMAYTAKQS
jgi:hypothetical protein